MNEPTPPGKGVAMSRSEKPLLFEPIKAYRHWDLSGGVLTAPHHNSFAWRDGENIAHCSSCGKSAVECARYGRFRLCNCGFYCVWSDRDGYARPSNLSVGKIFGVIELYGNVTLGPQGARATKAKIVALHVPPGSWRPFQKYPPVMDNYPSARFYRNRDNLIVAEGVEFPQELFKKTDNTGAAFG